MTLATLAALAACDLAPARKADEKPAPATVAAPVSGPRPDRTESAPIDELLAEMDAADAEVRDYSCRFVTTNGPASPMARLPAGMPVPESRARAIWRQKPDLLRVDDEYSIQVEKLGPESWHTWSRSLGGGRVSERDTSRKGMLWPGTMTPEGQLEVLHRMAAQPVRKVVEEALDSEPPGDVVTLLWGSGRHEYFVDEDTRMVTRFVQYEGDEVEVTLDWLDCTVNAGLPASTFELHATPEP